VTLKGRSVVVDSGGGRIAIQVARPLKIGGIISCYGSTTGEEMPVNSAWSGGLDLND
jgi:hypothetical protein